MDDTLEMIIRHGLMIRQIPREVVSSFDMRHFKKGDEEVEVELKLPPHKSLRDSPHVFRKEGKWFRKFARRVRVPNNPGYWMCKKVEGTGSTVRWHAKDDCLAPTLHESVGKWVEQNAQTK